MELKCENPIFSRYKRTTKFFQKFSVIFSDTSSTAYFTFSKNFPRKGDNKLSFARIQKKSISSFS